MRIRIVEVELHRLVEHYASQGTSADIAYLVLRNAISSGVLAPGVRLFANDLAVPLGLSFTRSLSDVDFLTLSPAQKAEALFHVVILPKSADGSTGLPTLTVPDLTSGTIDGNRDA